MSLDTSNGNVSFGNADTGESYGVAFENVYSTVGQIPFYPAFSFHDLNDKISLVHLMKHGKDGVGSNGSLATATSSTGALLTSLAVYTPLSSSLFSYTKKVLEGSTTLLNDIMDRVEKSKDGDDIESMSAEIDQSMIPTLLSPLLSGKEAKLKL